VVVHCLSRNPDAATAAYNACMALDELLGDVPRSRFMEDHFFKQPFARPGGCKQFTALGSWQALESILTQPGVDCLAGKEGRRWDGPLPPSPAEARRLVGDGYTLGVRHAERHYAGLSELAAGFHRDFLAPVNVHLYCTPAGQAGFGWHYDAEDVFLLQTQGSKEWWLRKNTVNPWPLVETLPADMRYEREVMPVLRCRLHAGDWLYIPAGYWHRTEAGEESISLSVGIQSLSALDVYDYLRRELLNALEWRQRLPPPGAASQFGPEVLRQRYQELFADLGARLADLLARPATVDSFLAHVRGGQRPEKVSAVHPAGEH
jgi:ribosomal protein L16 Arg81 hydroxylase